jgi:signal transduction histidine kinase
VGGNAVDFYLQPEQRRDLKDRLLDERVIRNFEAEFRRSDGEHIWVRDSSRFVEDDDGVFYEGALVDITARRRIEAALRARARQQEAIALLGRRALEGGDTDHVLSAAVRMVVDMLDAAAAAVVVPGESGFVIGASYGAALHGIEISPQLIEKGAAGSSPFIMASAASLASVAPELAQAGLASAASITIGRRETPNGYLWAFGEREDRFHSDDVTFLVALGNVLGAAIDRHRARQRLEELVRSKDEFIAAVSHELRTPLTVVSGMAHELHDSWNSFGDEERREFMNMLVDQSRDMSDLIEDLLVAARADIGKVTVSLQSVDATAEVELVLAGLERDALKRISVDYAEAEVVADPIRFRQIVRNLVTNAIRYGGDEVQVSIATEGDRVALRVSDDGPGVPEEDRERIFEAYHRAPAGIGQPGSVGLGLTVSRTLAELMGGTLAYAGDGLSTFVLLLPAAGKPPASQVGPGGSGSLGEAGGG